MRGPRLRIGACEWPTLGSNPWEEIKERITKSQQSDTHHFAAIAHSHLWIYTLDERFMITSVRNITSENPTAEIWKYLRLFLNVGGTAEQIRRIHKVAAGKYESDVKKQATQIAYCIRQAEQYFSGAAAVGIATKPVLLYYGCMSLSQALVLLKKDGTNSLDALRKAKKHRHHGLDLDQGRAECAAKATNVQEFFSCLQCSCHTNEGTPWGHFPLFYSSLDPAAFILRARYQDFGSALWTENDVPIKCADPLKIEEIKDAPLNALEIARSMPDLWRDLIELGVGSDLVRGNASQQTIQYYRQPQGAPGGTPVRDKLEHILDFFVDGISSEQKETLINFLKSKNPDVQVVADLHANLHLQAHFFTQDPTKPVSMYFPDIIEDIVGSKFYILKPTSYIHEAGGLLAILFCLGMLSRYFPEVWMATIDNNVEVSEITNSLLTIVARKFPNLILDQMTGIKHYVHL